MWKLPVVSDQNDTMCTKGHRNEKVKWICPRSLIDDNVFKLDVASTRDE